MDPTRKLAIGVLAVLTGLLVAVAAASLGWRIKHDAALMLYFAWLIDHLGWMPYRDFFEHQPPGAHWTFLAIGKIFGYGDRGFRVFDVLFLSALCGATFAWLAPLSRRVAWAGSVLFALAYLGHGPNVSAQRDYLMLLPVAGALLVQVRFPDLPETRRALVSGLLLGLAATVKPQIGVLLPAPVAYHLWRLRRRAPPAGLAAPLAAWAAGLALPTALMLVHLALTRALGPFAETVRGYWPLFGSLDGRHQTTQGIDRLRELATGLRRLGGHKLWLAPAAVGAALALFRAGLSEERRGQVMLMVALCLLAVVYTAVSGRFWDYHWLPFLYFLLMLASLCFLPLAPDAPARGTRAALAWIPLLVVLAVIAAEVRPPFAFRQQIAGRPLPLPGLGRTDEMAEYLRASLRSGDTVQALDWTGGAIQAMLIARAPAATPFVTDFSFYHHVSDPFIVDLRARFAASFSEAAPRFVLRVDKHKPWPGGDDTSRDFEEIDRALERDYRVDHTGYGYRIYRRRDGP